MQLYLKRWGFSSQKPLTRATQRDPQMIEAWLKKVYPGIAARAKREKALIYWSDETGVCNQDQIGKGYAPKGQTPVLAQTGQRFSTSMIAAVSNRGLMRFKLYKGALNVSIFIDFVKRLIKDAKQKVFLIVDNLRVHHAKAVKEWLAAHKDEIEIFYLPAYAPEQGPFRVDLKGKGQLDVWRLVSVRKRGKRGAERRAGEDSVGRDEPVESRFV